MQESNPSNEITRGSVWPTICLVFGIGRLLLLAGCVASVWFAASSMDGADQQNDFDAMKRSVAFSGLVVPLGSVYQINLPQKTSAVLALATVGLLKKPWLAPKRLINKRNLSLLGSVFTILGLAFRKRGSSNKYKDTQTCPSCGRQNAVTTKICPRCETKLG